VEENCIVPPPINFNCWKHHSGFIKKQIGSIGDIQELDELKILLLKIGESQMDLYYGDYSPLKISEYIIHHLNQNKIISSEQYNTWLAQDGKEYQLIELSDKSIWTLRRGEDVERYVHLHPGRYSPKTIRVRALTLKTSIFVLCWERINIGQQADIKVINMMRRKYLNDPPLKFISKESGLGKLLELFREKV